mgnify:CR=1 FL=1
MAELAASSRRRLSTRSATSPPLLGCGEGSDTVDFLNVRTAWGPVDLSHCERVSESEGEDPYAGRPIPTSSPLGSGSEAAE